jgi:hypothetical protein
MTFNSEEPIQLVSNANAAVDITSVPLNLGDMRGYSLAVDFSGGGGNLAGTLKLQASIDNSLWIDVTGSSQAVTSSTDHMWSVTDAEYRYVRVSWTFTSGTGNMTVKGIIKRNVVTGA